jgi:hypothetical protein
MVWLINLTKPTLEYKFKHVLQRNITNPNYSHPYIVSRVLTNNKKCNHTGLYGVAIWKGYTMQISDAASYVKGKREVHPGRGHEYSELMEVYLGEKWWAVSATPRPLYPRGKTWYPLYRTLGGPQGRYGRMRKIYPPHRDSIPGPDQPATSRYTDWAIPAPVQTCIS